MDEPNQSPAIRRHVLPSGEAIEVVVFEDVPTATPGALHVCPACRSELVHPVDWEEIEPERWDLALRCPNCAWEAAGVFELEWVERLDEELERGTDALVSDLRRLTRANMEEEVERFVSALQSGCIQPMDF